MKNFLVILFLFSFLTAQTADLPKSWQQRWQSPAIADRPLKIVHGLDPTRANLEGMTYYRQRGLGGVVFNVDFAEYMRSEEKRQIFLAGYDAGKQAGIDFWIYDEDGYPSGAAGGLVLRENPQFEALELAFDPKQTEPFILRPAFEYTHAANNFYAVRRYINIMDDRAVQSFIRHTHEQYRSWIQPFPGDRIKAFFTDEPSLIAVDLGQIPEQARAGVPVRDSANWSLPELPSVPWVYDLTEQYQKKYGQDIIPFRQSLFTGVSAQDRLVRRQFWSLIADLVSERYFGALQKWCRQNGLVSAGHILREESLIHHVPLYGNSLHVLAALDIPGLDMLNSDPKEVFRDGWLAAALPYSATTWQGRRRVMTEVSDFSQTMAGLPPVGLHEMCATAAWQASWGVTDFTLYYDVDKRTAADIKAYGDFVGRLNAILADSRRMDRVLLYYPIRDLWEEYVPVGKKLALDSQSLRAQRIINSFVGLGEYLQQHQINFALIDDENLASAPWTEKEAVFDALLLPDGVELPTPLAAEIKRKAPGMVVMQDLNRSLSSAEVLPSALRPKFALQPPCKTMVMSTFTRDGRTILLVSNADQQTWQGKIIGADKTSWLKLDPASGAITNLEYDGAVAITMAAYETVLLVTR